MWLQCCVVGSCETFGSCHFADAHAGETRPTSGTGSPRRMVSTRRELAVMSHTNPSGTLAQDLAVPSASARMMRQGMSSESQSNIALCRYDGAVYCQAYILLTSTSKADTG